MCIICDGGGLVLHEADTSTPADPVSALNAPDRGGTGPNGKTSFTPDQAGAQLTRSGASWNGTGVVNTAVSVTYAFRDTAPATMPNGTAGFSQFNATQITQTELSLQSWSDVANITFVKVAGASGYSNSAQMLFANYSSGASGAAAFAYFPGSGVGGDSWYNSTQSNNVNPANLNYGRQTITHEIGHAIGISHPGDYNAGGGPISYTSSAVYYEDTRQYSVMSYWSSSNSGGDLQGFSAAAPLLDDIVAAQRLYGANMTTRTGNDVYGFNSNTDRDFYTATSASSKLIFAVWDAGGTDTFDFTGYTQTQLIDLRQGHFSNVGGMTGNVTIAMGVVIENAKGGSGADTIYGNAAANVIEGGAGNDLLNGSLGADIVRGGLGADLVQGGQNNDALYGDDGDDTVAGGLGDDVAEGGAGRDQVMGGDGVDTLSGGAGADWLLGEAGADRLNGNEDADVVDGGDGDDIALGGQGDDQVSGGAGNDLVAGGLGVDVLTGGAGADTFGFYAATHSTAASRDLIQDFVSGVDKIDLLAVKTGAADVYTITSAGGLTLLNVDLGGDGVFDMQIALAGGAVLLGTDILF